MLPEYWSIVYGREYSWKDNHTGDSSGPLGFNASQGVLGDTLEGDQQARCNGGACINAQLRESMFCLTLQRILLACDSALMFLSVHEGSSILLVSSHHVTLNRSDLIRTICRLLLGVHYMFLPCWFSWRPYNRPQLQPSITERHRRQDGRMLLLNMLSWTGS